METYHDLTERHSKEFGDIPGMFFAFSEVQLNEGLEKVGLAPNTESHKLIVDIGAGGFILKEKLPELKSFMKRQSEERKELRKNRKWLLDALIYELNNHEYCYTGDPTEALEALDLTIETVPKDILKEAIAKSYREEE